MLSSDRLRPALPALGAALPLVILFITVLSIFLTTTEDLGLSDGQTASWIMVAYGLPGLLSLALAMHYRQPLVLTGNLFALIFVSSLAGRISYPELIGAFIVAGAGVGLVTVLGLTGLLASWIPAPVVLGLLAGAVMPFIADVFTSFGQAPLLVGGTVLAYVLSRRVFADRMPAILPALLAGLALAALTGHFGQAPAALTLPVPVLTMPVFSLQAVATATPVLVVVITLQANVPSVIFLQSEDYQPPERVLNAVSGLGTIVASLLGPAAVSLSLPATSLVAGERAGAPPVRYRAAYVAGAGALLVALMAGMAADVPALIPMPLLLALAGLALVDVLANALQQIIRGPLLLGPLFAFGIALSEVSLLGFGPFFWALVIGTATSLLLNRDALQ